MPDIYVMNDGLSLGILTYLAGVIVVVLVAALFTRRPK